MRRPKVVIVGGGIGGLAAAVALAPTWEVEVWERSATLGDAGAALVLWPNAVKALRRLGVESALWAEGAGLQWSEIRSASGRLLQRIANAELARRFGAPACLLHRSDLHAALLGALGDRAKVHLGARCMGVTAGPLAQAAGLRGNVAPANVVQFDDGRTAEGDLIIGADGLHSIVRTGWFDPAPPRYAGFFGWRGLIRAEESWLPPGTGVEFWGTGSRFGLFQTNRGDLFWFGTQTGSEEAGDSPAGRQADALARFGSWAEPVPTVIRATPPEAILRHPIYDRPPLPSLVKGRVLLLGDAAQSMTPQLGQGGCQALEDAAALGHFLGRGEIEAGLAAYDRLRRPHRAMIAARSRRMAQMQQVESPLLAAMRNLGVGLVPSGVALGLMAPILRGANLE